MQSRLIYKKSKALQPKINWIKPAETEWLYCGAEGEVKFGVVENEINNFFDGSKFYVATARKDSFGSTQENLLQSITSLVGVANFFVWDEQFQRVMEFNKIGVLQKGVSDAGTNTPVFKINYNKIKPGSPGKGEENR